MYKPIVKPTRRPLRTFGNNWKKQQIDFEKSEKRIKEERANPSKNEPVIPFEKRWNFTIEYHKTHTDVSEEQLAKRFEYIMSCRQKQIEMEKDPSAPAIIYYPRKAGLGNTVSSLANILLLSMMSNRRFYIYDWKVIFQFLRMPFDHVFLDRKIWDNDNMQLSNDVDECGLDYTGIINGTVTTQFIIIRTTCKLDQYFTHTKSLRQWFFDRGIIPSVNTNFVETYHKVMQFMLDDVIHPQQSIIDAVNEYKKSINWDSYNVLGMHLRTGLLEGNVGWGRFMEEKDVDVFLAGAKRYTDRYEVYFPTKKVKWFVLADNERVKETIRNQLGDYFITTNCTILHSKNRNSGGMFCSIVQNYLLSDCKFLILTFRSTYGYLAKHRTDVNQLNIQPGAWKKMK